MAAPWLFSYASNFCESGRLGEQRYRWWRARSRRWWRSPSGRRVIGIVVGLWVQPASPWLLGFQHATAMAVNVAVGLLIAFMSALELWLIHYDPAPYDGTRPALS